MILSQIAFARGACGGLGENPDALRGEHGIERAGECAPPSQFANEEVKVPGTLKRIRGEMDVKPTPRDNGLTLTLRVTAYDNGMIAVDGVPINAAPAYDPGHGWLGAAETALLTLSEFRRQAELRRQHGAGVAQ
jgi:hypothetical protein